jgi:hypothetical protein
VRAIIRVHAARDLAPQPDTQQALVAALHNIVEHADRLQNLPFHRERIVEVATAALASAGVYPQAMNGKTFITTLRTIGKLDERTLRAAMHNEVWAAENITRMGEKEFGLTKDEVHRLMQEYAEIFWEK